MRAIYLAITIAYLFFVLIIIRSQIPFSYLLEYKRSGRNIQNLVLKNNFKESFLLRLLFLPFFLKFIAGLKAVSYFDHCPWLDIEKAKHIVHELKNIN